MKYELVKIVAQPVIAVREGDRVVNEMEGQPRACYSPEALDEFWQESIQAVEEQNTAMNGNRATRRKAKTEA